MTRKHPAPRGWKQGAAIIAVYFGLLGVFGVFGLLGVF